jgi:lambda family phage portal protein
MSNAIDRAVEFISPERALRRANARRALAMMGGGAYHAADTTRPGVRGWLRRLLSADAATLPDLPALRDHSSDLVRNHPLAGGAIATVVTSAVGTGLAVQPAPDWRLLKVDEAVARAWAQDAKQWFELWAGRARWCDLAGRLDFYALQALAFRSALERGDCFALLPEQRVGREPLATKIQLIEADRVSNPDGALDGDGWAGGIYCDPQGRPLRAAIADRHPGDRMAMKPAQWEQREIYGATGRQNVLHLVEMLRVGQRRGVPYLAPVMEPLKQLGRYTDAEIMAAVISAAFTVFVEKPEAMTDPALSGTGATAPASGAPGSQDEQALGLQSGAMIDLLPGEKVQFADPSRPNPGFDPFVNAVFAQIGIGLQLPRDVLMKTFNASYSASRAALLEAWRFFRGRRQWLAAQFCQPIYEAVITEAVLAGRLRAPGFAGDEFVRAAWLRANWIGDAPGSIDPLKEATAARERCDLGISDKAAETVAYSGRNWEDVHAERVRIKQAEERDGLSTPPRAAPEPPPPDGEDEEANPAKPPA